jgi:PBSX family phage terminase large subunit
VRTCGDGSDSCTREIVVGEKLATACSKRVKRLADPTRLERATFAFEGLKHNVSRIRSIEGIDKAWAEEAQNISRSSWMTLIPTIRKDGSEIIVSFNPELETDETYQRFVAQPPNDAPELPAAAAG